MAVTRKNKEIALQELQEAFKGAKSIVFADYRGTTVKKVDELRKTLRKENIITKVAKITLIKKALEEQGIDTSKLDFKVPVAVAVSQEDEVAPAKLLSEFSKQNQNVKLLLGIIGGLVISDKEVMALAQLPGKHELHQQLVGTIAAPISGFVNVLAGNLRSLVYVLNAVKATKE